MSQTTHSNQYYFLNATICQTATLLLMVFWLLQHQSWAASDADATSTNATAYVPTKLISDIPQLLSDSLGITNATQEVPLINDNRLTNHTSSNGQQHHSRSANFSVITMVKNIETQLRSIRNVELGITTIQEIFDALDFTLSTRDVNETLIKVSKRLSKKLQKASRTVMELKRFIQHNITSTIDATTGNGSTSDAIILNTVVQPCLFEEQNYNKRQIEILNYLKNKDLVSESKLSVDMNEELLEEIRRLNVETHNFKHIYFLSNHDYASDQHCRHYFNNIHFRRLYVSAVQRKRIFILIDIGSALTLEQLEMSKTFVSNIVHILSDTDIITIVALSNEAMPITLAEKNLTHMYLATPDNKEELLEVIANLKRSSKLTNHSLGFGFVFNVLSEQQISKDEPFEFIYVTRGLLTRLSDAKSVLSVIARGQQQLPHPIVINACAVILDEKRIMYEKQFLNDLVQQKYSEYGIDVSQINTLNLKGNLYIITRTHPEGIIRTSTAVFADLFNRYRHMNDALEIHRPVTDYSKRDVIVSITHAVPNFGVVGVDLYLTDLAEDLMNYRSSAESYACLINTNGVAIVHPALQQSSSYLSRTPFPVDIGYLENSSDFLNVRKHMLRQESGNLTVKSDGRHNATKTYLWQRVLNIYIVCVVATSNSKGSLLHNSAKYGAGLKKFHHTEYLALTDLLYHRIDLISPQTPVCRYFRQIATLDTGTVFLSASSFQSPFTYIQNNRAGYDSAKVHTVQSIMAYLKDNTGLFANPGLLPRIRNDVSALYSVMEYLKRRHLENGEWKNYIIRRYAATVSGVLQIYPGCVLGTEFDPSQRPWFRKAMQHPGRIVVTEPYLDAGGAGHIITIGHTIFEGKAHALHSSERDSPVAIIALDVPYAFFYKLVLDTGLCQEENIKCLLFENEGYLTAHPSMMEPASMPNNMRRPHEHLTHKESFLANDILNHKVLVRKLACANYQNRTIQRYYTFNTSLNEVLTNVVHGERTKYQITAIRGTNIFAAVINSTCDGGAFCPCSTVDRICLNCNRMDQTDCECPCECPMHMKSPFEYTSTKSDEELLVLFRSYTVRYAYCEPPPSEDLIDNSFADDWNMALNSCVDINCDIYLTHTDCLAVMGCEWCQVDLDGNPFSAAFCTTQNACFNGVLSSLSPYGDGELGSAIIEPPKPQPYSTFGPVGGAIIVLCLVIGFAMYCYRQSLENGNDQFYVDSLHDDNYGVSLSRFNFDNIPPPDDGDTDSPIDGHAATHCNLLHPIGNAIGVSDISPYHMSTGSSYRRPPNGESDHGYSTMTPHEDSEHMCFVPADPLINNKRLSKSDSLSISTSVSSPTNYNNTSAIDRPVSSMGMRIRFTDQRYNTPKHNSMCGQTVLGDGSKDSDDQQQISPHHILARVTVHRHMEAL